MPKHPDLYFSLPAGLTAQVSGAAVLTPEKETKLLAQAYVPGIRLLQTRPRKTDINISGQWKSSLPLDVWHLLYSAVRVKLMEKGLYSVH